MEKVTKEGKQPSVKTNNANTSATAEKQSDNKPTTNDTNGVKKEKKKTIFNSPIGKVSKISIALSMRQLGLMLKSGLSLSDSVITLSDQASDKQLVEALKEVAVDINKGQTFATSMRKHTKVFSDIVVSIIEVGEEAGTLEKNLNFLSEYLKSEHELEKKVRGALIYPLVVFSLTSVEMGGVIFFILPKMQDLFSSFDDVPVFTLFILDVTELLRTNAPYIGGAAFIIFLAAFLYLRTPKGKITWDKIGLRFPVIKKLNKDNILTRFSRTLAILMESGIPISKSVQISADTINNYEYTQALLAARELIKNGKNVADSLSGFPKLFPSTYTKMVGVGEKTGTLEENLFYLYDYHKEEVEQTADNLSTLLEPILLIFVGLMIGLLAITIIAPIYQLTGSLT